MSNKIKYLDKLIKSNDEGYVKSNIVNNADIYSNIKKAALK